MHESTSTLHCSAARCSWDLPCQGEQGHDLPESPKLAHAANAHSLTCTRMLLGQVVLDGQHPDGTVPLNLHPHVQVYLIECHNVLQAMLQARCRW
jgi:hypothetical protein